MTAVLHVRMYGRLRDIEKKTLLKKKLHKTTQGSYSLEGSSTNKGSVRAPIQFINERQTEHIKRRFFLESKPHPFSYQ